MPDLSELDPTVQLLQLWNPRTAPHTIKLHVDQLLASPAREVWFGRIYTGPRNEFTSEEAARRKWPQVARVAGDMKSPGRELLLLATDFESLHAMRVDAVEFGDTDERRCRDSVPDYVKYTEAAVPLWFRVRDIRALRQVQAQTLDWLHENVWVQRDDGEFLRGFDPYRSGKTNYPLAIRTLAMDRIFGTDGGSQGFYASDPETAFPPDRRHAREELEGRMPTIWQRLEDRSKSELASARLQQRRLGAYKGSEEVEPHTVLYHLALVVEIECAAVHELMSECFPEAPVWKDEKPPITLGTYQRSFIGLKLFICKELFPRTHELVSSEAWLTWLNGFVNLRNNAIHPERPLVTPDDLKEQTGSLIGQDTGKLALLCSAKMELKEVSVKMRAKDRYRRRR